MKITRNQLRRIIKEEVTRALSEGDVVDFHPQGNLPWEFGPEGYASRGRGLEKKMTHLKQSSPEEILAVALSNRAEELIGYEKAVDPKWFSELAADIRFRLDAGWFGGGETSEDLSSIVSRIDSGDYFDEDIESVRSWKEDEWQEAEEMEKTTALARQQPPEEVEEMELDFDRFLQGITPEPEDDPENVIKFPGRED